MPPLQVCGRRWHIATDDLPLPALLGLVFHLCWAIWILVVFIKADQQLIGCGNAGVSTSSTMLLFWAFVLTSCIQAWLAIESWQGSIMDEAKRRRVPLAVSCLVAAYVLQLGSLIYATVVEARLGSMRCYTEHGAIHFSAWALIISTWVIAGSGLVLLLLLYSIVPAQDMEGWVDRCRCLGRLPCCWGGLTSSNYDSEGVPGDPPLIRLARVFGDLFTAVDFTFSDAAAALMLVGLVHKERGHASPMAAVAAAAELAEAVADGSSSDLQRSPELGSGHDGAEVAVRSVARPFEPGPKLPPAVAEAAMACLHLQQQHQRKAADARAIGGKGVTKQMHMNSSADPADKDAGGTNAGSRWQLLQQPSTVSQGTASTDRRSEGGHEDLSASGSQGGSVAANAANAGDGQHAPSQAAADAACSNDVDWDDVPLPLLEEALHWHRFANAIYGWPMYLWTRRYRLTFCCGLCCGRAVRCCKNCSDCGPGSTFCLPRPQANKQGPRPGAPMGVGPQLTREAIVQTAHIPDQDLLHFSLVNKMEGLLPYMVCLDRPRRCVVLAIRGSLSMEDVVTDLLFDPAPLEADWVMAPGQGAPTTDGSQASTEIGGRRPAMGAGAAPSTSETHGSSGPQRYISDPAVHSTSRTTTSDHLMAAGRMPSERLSAGSSSEAARQPGRSSHEAAGQLGRSSREAAGQLGSSSTRQLGRRSSRLRRSGSGAEEGIDAAHGLSDDTLVSRAVSTSDVAAGGAGAAAGAAGADAVGSFTAGVGASTASTSSVAQLSGRPESGAAGLTAPPSVAGAAAAAAAAAEGTPGTAAGDPQSSQAPKQDHQTKHSATKDKWYAHGAILSSARCIQQDLARTGLLDALLLGRRPNAPSPEAAQHTTQRDSNQQPFAQHSTSKPAAQHSSSSLNGVEGGSSAAGAEGDAIGDGESSGGGPNCRGWTLVVTGHSLGAGVAALLAMHLRTRYPNVRCWCFAPPGGLLSPAAAASLDDICHTLVSAKDMIPRLSLWTVEKLRDEMMLAALRCKVPKVNLLVSGLLGKKWTEAAAMVPVEQLSPAKWEQYQQYAVRVEKERSLDPLRVCIAREMIPPGRVIWLERHKGARPAYLHASNSDSALHTAHHAPQPAGGSPVKYAVLRRNSSGWTNGSNGGDVADSASNWSHAGSAVSAGGSGAANGEGSKGTQPYAHHPCDSSGSITLAPLLSTLPSLPSLPRLPRPWHDPHWTTGGSLIVGGVIVSKSMFADHVPDGQYANFKRMVRQLQKKAGFAAAHHTSGAIATFQRIGSGLTQYRTNYRSNAPSRLASPPKSNLHSSNGAHATSSAGGSTVGVVGVSSMGDQDSGWHAPGAVRRWWPGARSAGGTRGRHRTQEQAADVQTDVEMGLTIPTAHVI